MLNIPCQSCWRHMSLNGLNDVLWIFIECWIDILQIPTRQFITVSHVQRLNCPNFPNLMSHLQTLNWFHHRLGLSRSHLQTLNWSNLIFFCIYANFSANLLLWIVFVVTKNNPFSGTCLWASNLMVGQTINSQSQSYTRTFFWRIRYVTRKFQGMN